MIKKYKRILGVLILLKNLMKRIIYKLPKLREKITLNPTRSITIENIGKLLKNYFEKWVPRTNSVKICSLNISRSR